MSSVSRIPKLEAQIAARDFILAQFFESVLGEAEAETYREAVRQSDAVIDEALKQLDN